MWPFDLPVELLSDLFANWLIITDLPLLDSACCGRDIRQRFLAVAFSPQCCLRTYEQFCFKSYNEMNRWIMRRMARVPGLYLTESIHSELASEYFKTNGKFLHFMEIHREHGRSGYFNDALVASIVAYCCNLRKLETHPSLSSDNFVRIVRSCRLLEEVDMYKGEFSSSAIGELNNCPNLKSLYMHCLESEGTHVTCPTLETVILDSFSTVKIGDAFAIPLAQSCTRLKALRLENSCVTDATIDAIAANCKRLETFAISSDEITGAALERLTASCQLRWLGFHVPDEMDFPHFEAMMKNSSRLTMLCIYNDFEENLDDWLLAVANHCPQLRSLVLCYWYIGGPADGLLAVVQRCTALWHLDIDAEDQAGDAFCAAVSGCTKLRAFTMCHGVNESVLHALSKCPKLEQVELTGALQLIHEGSLIALAKGCPALEVLTIPIRAEVTIEVLRALARCCPGLTYLECKLAEELQGRSVEIASLLPRCEVKWSDDEAAEAGEEEEG